MTLDVHFRDQIGRGHPPMVALHNAAQAYAASLQCKCRTGTACKPTCTCRDGYQSGGCDMCGTYGLPDGSQYADETAAWSEPQDSEAVELLREGDRLMASRTTWTSAEMLWHDRVRNFLEGKQ